MASPDQFYTGLIAELYEPLAGGISPSDRFIEFVGQRRGPALELCCGTGLPLLDLIEAGLEVEGLDASADMLALCAEKARARELDVVLHQGLMQEYQIDRSFQSIYIANGSITLLPSDELLAQTLACTGRHLVDGGQLLIDLDSADPDVVRPFIDRYREADLVDGAIARFAITGVDTADDGRNVILRLRYERHGGGEVEIEERDWLRRVWTVDEMGEQLEAAGLRVLVMTPFDHGTTQIIAIKA